MPRRIVRVQIPWAPERLFPYMADLRNFAEWDPGVKRAALVGGSEPGPGATFELVVGGGIVLRYVTEAFEPSRRCVVRARTPSLESLDEITIAPSAEGSVLTYSAGLWLRGWKAVGNPFLEMVFSSIVNKATAGLCRVTEGRIIK